MQFNLQIIDTRMTFTTKADAWPIFKLCLGAISCFPTTQGPLIPKSAPQESRAGKSSGWIGWRKRLLLGPRLGLKTMQVTFSFNQYSLFKQSHMGYLRNETENLRPKKIYPCRLTTSSGNTGQFARTIVKLRFPSC